MNFVVISTLPRWQAGAAQRNEEILIKIDVQSSKIQGSKVVVSRSFCRIIYKFSLLD
jgi:hypothetical protein